MQKEESDLARRTKSFALKLAEADLVAPERLQAIPQQCGELIAIFVAILKRSKEVPS